MSQDNEGSMKKLTLGSKAFIESTSQPAMQLFYGILTQFLAKKSPQ